MRYLIVTLFALGCTEDPVLSPDAGVLDCSSSDASSDSSSCWMTRYAQCGTQIYYEVCVPYDGCVYWHCGATKYGYCGPGGTFTL